MFLDNEGALNKFKDRFATEGVHNDDFLPKTNHIYSVFTSKYFYLLPLYNTISLTQHSTTQTCIYLMQNLSQKYRLHVFSGATSAG